jgi:hypothetical protein
MTVPDKLLRALSELAVDDGFRLDGRSDEQLLQSFEDYVALIPFDSSYTWADFFFMSGNAPPVLAELSGKPDSADGTLLPQQAFMLAFLQLLKTPRALFNYLPFAHRDLYYRELLSLRESPAQSDNVVLQFALSPSVRECLLRAGTLFDAGETGGVPIRYALDADLLVNPSVWTDLRWVQPGDGPSLVAAIAYDQQQGAWPTAGVRLFDPEAQQQPVVVGRLIASDSLAMSTGIRTFTVTFGSVVTSADLTVAQVSGANGWLELALSSVSQDQLTLSWLLDGDQPAISPPDNLDGITMDVPVLKLGCVNGQTVPVIVGLSVQVEGGSAVSYGTDSGANRLDGASYPFGTMPVVGSGFNLIAADWCEQTAPLELTLAPRWLGLPDEGFPDWYANYDSDVKPADNSDFKVQALLMSSSGAQPLSSSIDNPAATGPQPLFAAGKGAPAGASLTVAVPPMLPTGAGNPSNPCDWPRWLRFELTGRDFGHQDYQKLAGTTTLNPPYTPQINAMTVSYAVEAADIVQYLLTPFGYMAEGAQPDDPDSSYLYVGLTDGTPGETLSLYWQLQSPQSLQPAWEYLNQANTWASLGDTLVDDTQGLMDCGLWTAVLPHDAATDAPQMPSGRYWLRAVLDQPCALMNPARVNESAETAQYGYVWLQGISANGMTATLDEPQTVPASHFTRPLPAFTVTRAVTPVAGLSSVTQPWSSSGGRPAETPSEFFSRVAQRLSHRNRALTWQDMAALLQAHFSNVFDVALPPADSMTDLPASLIQTVVAIPVNEKKDNQDPLRPQFSQAHLNEMKQYLQGLASAWARIEVVNPRYRDVRIAYNITFNVNPDYGYRQLQERLTLHYMPWILGGPRGVTLGNTLDYYGIIAWIQQQPFVTSVNSMTLNGQSVSIHAQRDEVLILTWQTTASCANPTGRTYASAL